IHTLNTSNRRQNRDVENTTPAPPIEEVEHSPSIISRKSQRHLPYPTSPHNNTNINNPNEAQNNNQSQDSSNYKVAVSG
ncbi:6174_t:CDS:2, partial [Dentiscutata heterogama]